MHHVNVLITGYSEPTGDGRHRAVGTVTLLHGAPNILVDTGDPAQRQQLLDALAAQGLAPAAIEYVVNTHGHLDHVGNNNLFPDATFVLDTDLARGGVYWSHDFTRGPLFLRCPPGETPVTILRTAGHTDHDLSVIATAPIGVVAIVGDLFEYEGDGIDRAWVQWSRNPRQQRASRSDILGRAQYIVPGHGGLFAVSPELRDREA